MALSLFTKSTGQTVSLQGSRNDVLDVVKILNKPPGIPTGPAPCEVDKDTLKKIMSLRSECMSGEASTNEINMYSALARIASCKRNKISHIGVKQKFTNKGFSVSKCVVDTRAANASIGKGDIEIKTEDGNGYAVSWSVYDLTGRNLDEKYWLEQIEPKIRSYIGNTEFTGAVRKSAPPSDSVQ